LLAFKPRFSAVRYRRKRPHATRCHAMRGVTPSRRVTKTRPHRRATFPPERDCACAGEEDTRRNRSAGPSSGKDVAAPSCQQVREARPACASRHRRAQAVAIGAAMKCRQIEAGGATARVPSPRGAEYRFACSHARHGRGADCFTLAEFARMPREQAGGICCKTAIPRRAPTRPRAVLRRSGTSAQPANVPRRCAVAIPEKQNSREQRRRCAAI